MHDASGFSPPHFSGNLAIFMPLDTVPVIRILAQCHARGRRWFSQTC